MTFKRRKKTNRYNYNQLEPRKMLAGDVQVIVSDAILLVVGDDAANEVQVTQSGGNYTVTGVDTTINGGSTPAVVSGINFVTISMAGGNDIATITDLNVARNLSFYGGDGNDEFVAVNSVARHLHSEGNAGDDVFQLDLTTRKSAYIYLGTGNDVVSSQSLFAGRNLKVFADDGNDTISAEQVSAGRRLEVRTGNGDDQVLISGSVRVAKETRFELGSGNDFLGVLPQQTSGNANFGEKVVVSGGDGDDSMAFDESVRLNEASSINGDAGNDSAQRNSVGRGFNLSNVEVSEVADLTALVNSVETRLSEVGIGETDPGEPDVDPVPLELVASTDELSYVENSPAEAVDLGIALTGDGEVTVAEVSISNFIAGEVLSFIDTDKITGEFSPSNGVLTLTGAATTAEYQAALQSVLYENTSENPVVDQRVINFSVVSGDTTVRAERNFTILAVNDAPTVVVSNSSRTVLLENSPVVVDAGVTLNDVDTTNLQSVIVRISDGYVSGDDVLSGSNVDGITYSFDDATGELTLTGDVSAAVYQQAVRTVSLSSVGAGAKTILITAFDGTDSTSAEAEITYIQSQSFEFSVSESAANGTLVGQVSPQSSIGTPLVYQLAGQSIPDNLLLNADDHRSGTESGPVVLIEYLDFECPACAAFHPIIQQIEDDFAGDLLVVRRHLPLEAIHENARAAAIASEAAARQGMFDEMADILFENQGEWNDVADPSALFQGYAGTIGLDVSQFISDSRDNDLNLRVNRDASEANDLGATGTPSFFLDGESIGNPGSGEALSSAIQDVIDANTQPFTIDRGTGQITVYDTSLLDAATASSVELPILVTDTNGNTETINVTIDVTA
jgi:protein-disulfide isomerase